jgi:hypothetical protein
VGGLGARELNGLEVEFICLLKFELFTMPETMERFAEQLYQGLPISTRCEHPVCEETSLGEPCKSQVT